MLHGLCDIINDLQVVVKGDSDLSDFGHLPDVSGRNAFSVGLGTSPTQGSALGVTTLGFEDKTPSAFWKSQVVSGLGNCNKSRNGRCHESLF